VKRFARAEAAEQQMVGAVLKMRAGLPETHLRMGEARRFVVRAFLSRVQGANGRDRMAPAPERRIWSVEPLLLQPQADIDRIAVNWGFDSRAHFNCVFARITGRTPRMV
jgi:transcriptional regulator GlxA family with amidase domain